MTKKEIILSIEDSLKTRKLNPGEIEIGAQDLQTLGSLLKVYNLFQSKKCVTFTCSRSESEEIVNYFLEKGMQKSNFSMSSQPTLFLMY